MKRIFITVAILAMLFVVPFVFSSLTAYAMPDEEALARMYDSNNYTFVLSEERLKEAYDFERFNNSPIEPGGVLLILKTRYLGPTPILMFPELDIEIIRLVMDLKIQETQIYYIRLATKTREAVFEAIEVLRNIVFVAVAEPNGIVSIPENGGIMVSWHTSMPGKVVDVTASIFANPGPGIYAIEFFLNYDSEKIKLIGFEIGDVLSLPVEPPDISANPLKFSFENKDIENSMGTGTLITFRFLIDESASEGFAPIWLDRVFAFSTTFDVVYFGAFDGGITVKQGDIGNVKGFGDINAMDVLLIRQYIAGWGEPIVSSPADVSVLSSELFLSGSYGDPVSIGDFVVDPYFADCNGDGVINAMDVLLLRQYIAGWDVNLG